MPILNRAKNNFINSRTYALTNWTRNALVKVRKKDAIASP
ncbi:hypothetical protein COO91_09521 (plasmid) [Nostoc flagelliforme CCNUN1]|uniref:Uncharacterized protein n=1 Tax=Nostoc flagelliforme CCNUN1 TaxID=2038116 RepID=A0A2K8T6L1_9NOSO|nr:hypothetical protein COO91_09521 [Nostoc flagelliforme CCNUN1]